MQIYLIVATVDSIILNEHNIYIINTDFYLNFY